MVKKYWTEDQKPAGQTPNPIVLCLMSRTSISNDLDSPVPLALLPAVYTPFSLAGTTPCMQVSLPDMS